MLSSAPPPLPILDARAERGPHQSASEFGEFLAEEFLDFIDKGYWLVLPYESVRNLPGLRLSPVGCVPQRDRRPRIIVDYTFYGVNQDTIKLSDPLAMQFGHALRRILQSAFEANPAHGVVKTYKIDLSDGFYRIRLASSGIAKLGVVLPPIGKIQRPIAFPLVLPMGWVESPPFFCAFTETAADLANLALRRNLRFPPHPLEDLANSPRPKPDAFPQTALQHTPSECAPDTQFPRTRPLSSVDVYVDDFVGIGQEHPSNPLENQRRTVMHCIDAVFRPNDVNDKISRKEPISTKKLSKGDASWQDHGRILGWDIDCKRKTIHLPEHRRTDILDRI